MKQWAGFLGNVKNVETTHLTKQAALFVVVRCMFRILLSIRLKTSTPNIDAQ
jgi:hypothetical protein